MATDVANSQLRTTAHFGKATTALMRERQMGVRQLARQVEISPGYLSRVLREVDGRRPSPQLVERVREALGLPAGFFVESRLRKAVALLEQDPGLVDQITPGTAKTRGA
jgi:transcriptional regulator with XRE-family HTH domain